MTTSEFQPGDRVRVTREGTVQFTDQGGARLYFWRPDAPLAWCRSDEATLIERPMPPLPTTFGSSIVATVRGVPNVLLVRTNYTPSSAQYNWLSGTPVDDARWHTDSHITEWRPWVSLSDTTTLCPDSGMSRFACQASDICDCFEPRVVPATPQPEPVCKCGHWADEHNAGQFGCLTHRDECQCVVYRPATPQPEYQAGVPVRIKAHPGEHIDQFAVRAIAKRADVEGLELLATHNDTTVRVPHGMTVREFVADWLDEQGANPTATWPIRREVGESDE